MLDPLDPIYNLMPNDQCVRVFGQDMCDIDATFLGFTAIYQALASIIPLHWDVIDFGCAYSPQAHLFKEHSSYHGVDFLTKERFSAPNTKHYEMTVEDFIHHEAKRFDKRTTFAICSYVPDWGGDNRGMVRAAFENVFIFYPASGKEHAVRFASSRRNALDKERGE